MRWPWQPKTPKKRTPRQQTGDVAERAAARHLRRSGCRILARNVRCPSGEVDLVALEKATRTLCFVEVRSRALRPGEDPFVGPAETVTATKRRRVVRAAQVFLKQWRAGLDRPIRFDVIVVHFDGDDRKHPDIRHLRAAFDATGRAT